MTEDFQIFWNIDSLISEVKHLHHRSPNPYSTGGSYKETKKDIKTWEKCQAIQHIVVV